MPSSTRFLIVRLAALLVGSSPAVAFAQTAVIPSSEPVLPPVAAPPPVIVPTPVVAPTNPQQPLSDPALRRDETNPIVALPPGTRIVTSGDTTYVLLPDTPPPTPVPQPIAPAPVAARGTWYGWQTLLADGTGIVISAGSQSSGGFIAGSFVAPPVIHLLHGRPLAALESGGLRLGLPVAGGLMGAALTANMRDDTSVYGGIAVGALVGYLTAVVVDAAVLSYENPAPRVSKGARAPSIVVQPTLTAKKNGGEIGIVGAF